MRTAMTVVPVESLAVAQHVRVHSEAMHIQDLSIERPSIVAYLRNIAPEKLEVALMHALEVGIVEMQARRERWRP